MIVVSASTETCRLCEVDCRGHCWNATLGSSIPGLKYWGYIEIHCIRRFWYALCGKSWKFMKCSSPWKSSIMGTKECFLANFENFHEQVWISYDIYVDVYSHDKIAWDTWGVKICYKVACSTVIFNVSLVQTSVNHTSNKHATHSVSFGVELTLCLSDGVVIHSWMSLAFLRWLIHSCYGLLDLHHQLEVYWLHVSVDESICLQVSLGPSSQFWVFFSAGRMLA